MVNKWISQLKDKYQQAGNKFFYMIIDQSGLDYSIIPALNLLFVEWRSLWKGLPEENAESEAPLLIRIELQNSQQQQWLEEICEEAARLHAVLALGTLWPMETLAEWLQGCCDASHEGRNGLLRFYDPRVLPVLCDGLLTTKQQKQLHRPVLFWSWIDRDTVPQWLTGNGVPPVRGEKVKRIDLTDRQFEYLMCICDVNIMLAHADITIPSEISREILFETCYQGMVEATDNGVFMDDERERVTLSKLASKLTCGDL